MKIDSRRKFKDTFNKLFKKYHPDNQETGDAELFIKYKTAYDEALKMGVLHKLPEEVIGITTEQAFSGTTIDYKNVQIVIPPKFHRSGKTITFEDMSGERHYIKIDIVPIKDEAIHYDEFREMEIERFIHITTLDVILGFTKTLDIFKNRIILNYKPYEILKGNAIKWFPGCGFWKIREPNERNPLKIKFIIEKTDFEEEDRKILEGLREKYAKGK